jgi:hypothetical protein
MYQTLTAAYDALESLVHHFLAALDGIPDEDLASWKPAAAGADSGEINTFAALGVHTPSAGRWMLFHQVFGDEVPRDREAEFHAVATGAEIDENFRGWLADFRARIDAGSEVDLSSMPPTIRDAHPTWTRLHWLFHMIDHTALHVGHVQIQRQLWLDEKATHPQ